MERGQRGLAQVGVDRFRQEFDELARAENAKLRTERALFLEVCLGEGWTKQRSKFFPRSTLKCPLRAQDRGLAWS